MKILTAQQTREWDAFTIREEPIASIDLMERAAFTLFQWFLKQFPSRARPVVLVCGSGNNGGDGLVLARLLYQKRFRVSLWLVPLGDPSPDFTTNLERLPSPTFIPRFTLQENDPFPELPDDPILVDALFGSGLNRPLEGFPESLIRHLNQVKGTRVAIDLPSGLFADLPSEGTALHADLTFSFQLPKLAFFFPENEVRVGKWFIGDIRLSKEGLHRMKTDFHYQEKEDIKSLLRPRGRYSHKGTFGHTLLIAGSHGKVGAAILSARACLRAGTGLLSLYAPACAYEILQQTAPEAMVQIDPEYDHISEIPDLTPFASVGIGPGLGKHPQSLEALNTLLQQYKKPMVLDADALNLISEQPGLLEALPPGSILTPHPGEFRRLFGEQSNTPDRWKAQRDAARKYQIVIVLKGGHTSIALPDGKLWLNGSGNPGMATGGSGDVLTGILAGLLAQGYLPAEAARLGVFLHGLAGDLATDASSPEALVAGDIVAYLGEAFSSVVNDLR